MSQGALPKGYEFTEVESHWYRYWEERDFFRADETSPKPPYSIVIPPPNVTGQLHMGHALNNTLQDILCRYKRLKGFEVLWVPGTDHAGIATQNVVERQLGAEGLTRHGIGREAFLAARMGMEGKVWRNYNKSVEAARGILRLVPRAVYHGRGPLSGRAPGFRIAL